MDRTKTSKLSSKEKQGKWIMGEWQGKSKKVEKKEWKIRGGLNRKKRGGEMIRRGRHGTQQTQKRSENVMDV